MTISARSADRVRKAAGYALATGITLLLFRVLGRTAGGVQSLADGELWALVALMTLAVAWVSAARRVRREQRTAAEPEVADAEATGHARVGRDDGPPTAPR